MLFRSPSNPKDGAKINNTGKKNRNCLLIANRLAFTAFPIVCRNILLIITKLINGKDKHCAFNANVPIFITSKSSFLNIFIMSGAITKPTIEITHKKIVATFTQNQKASRTLSTSGETPGNAVHYSLKV